MWSLRIFAATFPTLEQVFVSSRTRKSREEFCAKMSQDVGCTVTPVDDPLRAVRDADIVITSIPPGDARPISGEAIAPGALVIPLDLVNAWQDDVLSAVDGVAADNPAHFAAQVQAKRATAFPDLKPVGRIQDLVAGRSPRASASDRSLVAVCGIASTDVVVGWEIYRRARAASVGLEFDMLG